MNINMNLRSSLHILMSFSGIAIFTIAIWVLFREVKSTGLNEIAAQFNAIPVTYIVTAFFCMALSYFLLTNYDVLAFKYLGEKFSYRHLAPIAFSAFAVGHNVGVASLSGGAIRYRAYSLAGLTSTQIATIIAFIPVTFDLGVAMMFAILFLFWPAEDLSSIPLNIIALRITGSFLLSVMCAVLLLIAFYKQPIRIGMWQFKLPSLRLGIYQILLSCSDIITASFVLFVLLKASTDISYPVLLTAFLLSMIIGVISTVPGAIGVFESSMVLLLPQIPSHVLLGAILAYRLIYYLIPLLIALALIAFREAIEHKHRVRKLTSAGLDWGTRIAPHTLGVATFVAGAYLLMHGSIPLEIDSDRFIAIAMPLQVLEMSHLLSSAIGVGLLLVARGLYRRLHRAWIATLFLLLASLLAGLAQFNGIYHLAFIVSLLILVWVSRAEFYRGKRLIDQRFDTGWIFSITLVMIAALGIGLLANQNIEYSSDLWWQFTLNGEASRMMRALLLAFVLLGAFALVRFLRGDIKLADKPNTEEIRLVNTLVATDKSSFTNIALLGDKRFMFHPSNEAFLMYQTSGRSWIALGDPVGNPEKFEELLWQFRETCDASNARCAFYQITSDYLPTYIDLGFSFLKLGEEGIVNLVTFSLEGSHRADLRQALNKAKRNGLEFSVVPADQNHLIIDRLEEISNSWLVGKATQEKGFSLGFFDRDYIRHFDCAVVWFQDEIVAFANLWKGGTGIELSLDLMRYAEDAPKGLMDYLFTEIMLWGKDNGFQEFSLGMAPLSGLEQHNLATAWHKLGNLVYRFGENFYNFEGLRAYKEKFEPVWEPRFLACKGGLQVPAILLDTTVLISGGYGRILPK